MNNTGGKTSGLKLNSLALSADLIVIPATPIANAPPASAAPTTPKSYAERLAREHGKVMGTPDQKDSDLFAQFRDVPENPVLILETSQILKDSPKQKVKPTDQPSQKATQDKSTSPFTIPKQRTKASNASGTEEKTVAPRAQPFSEDTHVRVKIIVQDTTLNAAQAGTSKTESITWMQRDAIQQYVSLRDMERRRAVMKGAVYTSFQHDA